MHPVLKEALERSPVMPVLVIPELSMAKPLAEALASGGLTVFEITLRTAYNRADDPSKLDAIFGGRPAWAGGETADLPSFTFENVPIGELVVDPEDNKVYEFLGGNRDNASSWKEVQF